MNKTIISDSMTDPYLSVPIELVIKSMGKESLPEEE
jgi:hypothetical protein